MGPTSGKFSTMRSQMGRPCGDFFQWRHSRNKPAVTPTKVPPLLSVKSDVATSNLVGMGSAAPMLSNTPATGTCTSPNAATG